MRLIRPAWQLNVDLSEARPARITALKKQNDREDLQGKVIWSAGPWRSSGDWWTKKAKQELSGPWDREEWDIALASEAVAEVDNGANGAKQKVALYRIYRDIGSGHWFADASYD